MPTHLLQQGEKKQIDDAQGWEAWVMPDTKAFPHTAMMAMMRRPTKPNPHWDYPMHATRAGQQPIPCQGVFLKVEPSLADIKARLSVFSLHTAQNCKDEMKLALLIGRIFLNETAVDLFGSIDEDALMKAAETLNDGQKMCFLKFLREIRNKLALIEGPFGTGINFFIRIVCELLAKYKHFREWITAASNAAADAVDTKFVDSPIGMAIEHKYINTGFVSF